MLDRLWVKALIEAARQYLWEDIGADEVTTQALLDSAHVRPPRSQAERLMLLGIVADIREKAVSQRLGSRAVDTAVLYIREHSRKATLTRRQVARALDVSESWLAHRFKHDAGASFAIVLSHARLDDGAALLRTTGASVKEIALTVGFRSATGFTRAFIARFGAAPAAWRQAPSAKRQALRTIRHDPDGR